jgi:hypothetical protein
MARAFRRRGPTSLDRKLDLRSSGIASTSGSALWGNPKTARAYEDLARGPLQSLICSLVFSNARSSAAITQACWARFISRCTLKVYANGAMEGTLDSVDQGAIGLLCANFRLKDKELSFDVPSVGGKWHGTVSDDGAVLKGSWSQGQECR